MKIVDLIFVIEILKEYHMTEVSLLSQTLRSCGIDVHLEVVVATIKGDGLRKKARSFFTFTSSLTE